MENGFRILYRTLATIKNSMDFILFRVYTGHIDLRVCLTPGHDGVPSNVFSNVISVYS